MFLAKTNNSFNLYQRYIHCGVGFHDEPRVFTIIPLLQNNINVIFVCQKKKIKI